VAESTGKDGRAIIRGRRAARLARGYGHDRVFVAVALPGDLPAAQIDGLSALEAAGHPVVRIELGDAYGLAQGVLSVGRIATAVAGAVMGINPFDQPESSEQGPTGP